jgi:hypothetical protein
VRIDDVNSRIAITHGDKPRLDRAEQRSGISEEDRKGSVSSVEDTELYFLGNENSSMTVSQFS